MFEDMYNATATIYNMTYTTDDSGGLVPVDSAGITVSGVLRAKSEKPKKDIFNDISIDDNYYFITEDQSVSGVTQEGYLISDSKIYDIMNVSVNIGVGMWYWKALLKLRVNAMIGS